MAGTLGSGRPKGALNKKTRSLEEQAKKLNVNPFEILCLFAAGNWQALGYRNGSQIDSKLRVLAAKEAAKYLYPVRKAVEVSTEEGKQFVLNIKDYTDGKT